MNKASTSEILSLLDHERQGLLNIGITRIKTSHLVREISADGKTCEIVYSQNTEEEIDRVIANETATARREKYDLEWKLYGHDQPQNLGVHLEKAGFIPDESEAFLVLRVEEDPGSLRQIAGCEIRRISSNEGLDDVRKISEEVYNRSFESQIRLFQTLIRDHPESMCVYVAYVNGEPAAYGRVYFNAQSKFAGLYGGQTRVPFRNRGIFTQLVKTRVKEAYDRGIRNISVDALPTSEPILKKLGFRYITFTRPYRFKV